MQLVSMISSLCGRDRRTSQTDGQSDGRDAIAITWFALYSASRGKNVHHCTVITDLSARLLQSNSW